MSDQPFIPDIWSNHVLESFKYSMNFLDPALDKTDVWDPTGERYDEALAWAALLEVQVAKPRLGRTEGLSGTFRISKPGRIAAVVPICGPAVLIKHIKAYAEGNMDMGAATEELAKIMIHQRK